MIHRTTELSQYFSGNEVLTSAELILRLTKGGYSEDNARQVIRRHAKADSIWRSSGLRLPRNERLFAPAAFCGKPSFLGAVALKLAAAHRYGLARCLSVLCQRPVLHKVDVMRLLAVAPAAVLKPGRTLTRVYESELAGMCELGVEVAHPGTVLESVVRPDQGDGGAGDVEAQVAAAAQSLRKELVLARVLVERMRQQNFLAWNQAEVPEPSIPYTIFNDQVFTASGFSYLSPVVRWKDGAKSPTPCPVVIDCYHDRCMLAQVQSFRQRIDRIANRGKSRQRVLGVIGAREFEREAWNEARKQGMVVVNFRQTFGDEALEVMAQIEELIRGVRADTEVTPNQTRFSEFSQLLEEVKSNPIVATLRAIGFEVLSGLIMRQEGYEQVELGRIARWQQTTRDIDVMGIKGDALRIIECKAYNGKKSISSDEVRKFFTETVPACKNWLRSTGRSFTLCIAEIWTTGRKGKDAGDTLYRLKRPRSDTWGICRIEEIKKFLPRAIKERSLALLNSIAAVEIDGSATEEYSIL